MLGCVSKFSVGSVISENLSGEMEEKKVQTVERLLEAQSLQKGKRMRSL
jgi:hypothetical protein